MGYAVVREPFKFLVRIHPYDFALSWSVCCRIRGLPDKVATNSDGGFPPDARSKMTGQGTISRFSQILKTGLKIVVPQLNL